MGDDLSVTMHYLPRIKRLVTVPEAIYDYRVGGGTSKFMPYMLDDFISLYKEKNVLIKKYPIPQNAKYFMDIELMNVVVSWLRMCYGQGRYRKLKFQKECRKICEIPVIREAAWHVKGDNKIAAIIYQKKQLN